MHALAGHPLPLCACRPSLASVRLQAIPCLCAGSGEVLRIVEILPGQQAPVVTSYPAAEAVSFQLDQPAALASPSAEQPASRAAEPQEPPARLSLSQALAVASDSPTSRAEGQQKQQRWAWRPSAAQRQPCAAWSASVHTGDALLTLRAASAAMGVDPERPAPLDAGDRACHMCF